MLIASIRGAPDCKDVACSISPNDLAERRVVAYLCGVRPPLEKGASEPGLGKAVRSNFCRPLPFGGEGSYFDLRRFAVLDDGDMGITRMQ